ncbi:MAG: M1 family metallopeptidase [Chitinophagaceae bacterium]
MKKISLFACVMLFISCYTHSYAQDSSVYNQHDLFNPDFFTQNGNEYRSAAGTPGPKYWQNSANYLIHATLTEAPDTTITGDVTIDYTNNSPDSLKFLWLQVDQNLFDPHSRGISTITIRGGRFDMHGFKRGGEQIKSVSVTYKGKSYAIKPVITDTRMQLRLPFVVKPGGDKVTVKVNFSFAIPEYGADRMGRLYTQNGVVYQIAQWYPRMCVYDDVMGWNTLPYMGAGEFYCEYGNYDYYITLPSDMIVNGSGDLQNPQDVLTSEEINRLGKAKKSDSTVFIVSQDEIGKPSTRPKTSGTLTWHYKMNNTRDVSWAASKAFIWDAARINFPSGRKGIAMAAYPIESVGYEGYGRATQYLKQSIEFYSKTYFEYPWNSASAVAGIALGMEYPGIVFCSYKIKNEDLWGDITHEIGHDWFPMIVGSNERRYMWQDEGFNTFINGYATKWFNNGEYYNERQEKGIANYMTMSMASPKSEALMLPPDATSNKTQGEYYYKTSYALNVLRNIVLDTDRFDYAFKNYVATWAFKHPQPDDFFRFMNNATGEDLGWFWKEWFFTTYSLDQAVSDVKYVNDNAANGAYITIDNLQKMALPVIIKVTEQNGDSSVVKLPVDIWSRGGKWTFKYDSKSPLKSVVIDPERVLPDIKRNNNSWQGQ